MTTQVLTSRDFNWLELLKVRAQNLASAPSTPQPGWVYFDTALGKLRVCTNATGPVWVNLDGSDIPDSAVTSAKIADLTIVNGDISASAAIALSKLATDPLARGNHTGSQAASTISDLAAVVKAYRLDEFADPTSDIPMAGMSFTGLREPANPQDPATKNYVDLARAGLRLKDSVRAATTGPITLSAPQTVDGVAVVADERVLVKNQGAADTNGVYLVKAGAWVRAADADTAAELTDGATVWVNEGSQANTTWAQINTVTALAQPQSWSQQGAAAVYTGGNGIDVTGQSIDLVPGNGILADGTNTRVDPAVVARKYTATVGDGVALFYVKNHALSNQWVTAQVFRNTAPYDLVDCDVELTDANNVTIRFSVAPTSAQHRLVVTG